VEEVSAGYVHSLSRTTAGAVRAWGSNAVGQLGDGTTVDRRSPVGVLSGAEDISAGLLHSLAAGGGNAWGWGWNAFGQLGDGTTTDRSTPVLLAGSPHAFGVAAGAYHSLAAAIDPLPVQ
jgi:hypothetical protein